MQRVLDLLKNKKLLIFDFDGTLANTSPLHEQAFKEAIMQYNITFAYSDIAGLSTRQAFELILSVNNITITPSSLTELVSKKQDIARNLVTNFLEPIDGLNTFLEWAVKNYKMCIVSSGSTASVTHALQKLGYNNIFHPVICSENVSETKPSPEGFLQALDLCHASPDESLVFEDANSGFTSAKAANISFVDVNSFAWTDFDIKAL
jgi:HAD superfamily hydrolase (TIGR01509 family)